MIGDRELSGFRQGYYELLIKVFLEEPSTELLQMLGQALTERIEAASALNSSLAEGWEEIGRYLEERAKDPRTVKERLSDEYTRLFIGPYGAEINPYESYYRTGKLFGTPLIWIRNFLKRVGLEKSETYHEPEDHIAFACEIMRQLILRQERAKDPDEETKWLNLQGDFLKAHLLKWTPKLWDDLEKARSAEFYRGIAKIARGFFELEKEFLADWGSEEPAHLIRVKEGGWKGPLLQIEEP